MNEHSFILSEVRQEIKDFLPSRGNFWESAAGIAGSRLSKIAAARQKFLDFLPHFGENE